MIRAAGNIQPLPVRPIDGIAIAGTPAPLAPRGTGRVMLPLPMPQPDVTDLAAGVRNVAYQRMLDRLGVQQPLPIVDPTI